MHLGTIRLEKKPREEATVSFSSLKSPRLVLLCSISFFEVICLLFCGDRSNLRIYTTLAITDSMLAQISIQNPLIISFAWTISEPSDNLSVIKFN